MVLSQPTEILVEFLHPFFMRLDAFTLETFLELFLC